VLVAVLLGAWPVPLARLGVTRGPAGGVEDGIPAGGLLL